MLRELASPTTIGHVEQRNRVIRLAANILEDEYLDLYALAAAALVFTILGVIGIASIADLASMILALLTVLAFSQIRSRRQIAGIANARRADPFSLFAAEFPPDLIRLRASATDLLLIGITMSRTVQGSSREDMRQTLLHGGRIRILLLDPTDDSLLEQAVSKHGANLNAQRLRARIQATLDELTSLRASINGKLEIRVAGFVPSMGINAINSDSSQGVLVVQHYQHKPPAEAAPIISLGARDGSWYGHFLAEAERMWQDSRPWPLARAHTLARAPRPAFLDAFGTELDRSMSGASDLLITGVARNTLLTSSYSEFEEWLRHGCQIRFLLVNPSSDYTVSYAAERYYAERSLSTLRERINHALRLLEELQRSTAGTLSVRLTSYPLPLGIIAVDSTPALRSETSAIFAEYYTYQAPGKPKFVLQPTDGRWYDNVLGEAEALWASATEYPLGTSHQQ
jgi:hypothetical protein